MTTLNLKVIKADPERNLLLIRGAVPGPQGRPRDGALGGPARARRQREGRRADGEAQGEPSSTAPARAPDERDLPDELFGGEVNEAVMHQVVTAQLAAARSGTASTKTRSEVRGGGTKPWRQKGTGRARHGSIRSPIWVGGGAVFGPKPRDYSLRVNKKMRKAALALGAGRQGRATDRSSSSTGSTRRRPRRRRAASRQPGSRAGSSSCSIPTTRARRTVDRAFRNLDKARSRCVGSLGTYDVLVADAIVFTERSASTQFAARTEEEEASA